MILYLLLARHGAIDWDTKKPEQDQRLKDDGKEVREVAARLAELLRNRPDRDRITIGEIWHGSHLPVRDTAKIFQTSLKTTGKLCKSNQWHTNKAFWQQEQGMLATGLLALLEPGEAGQRYLDATLQTLAFWDRAFIDREIGGDRMSVTREGAPLSDPKGTPGKSSYHSVEMGRLAIEFELARLVGLSPSDAETNGT